MTEKEKYAENIRRALIELRQANNYKQTDIAEKVGKSHTGYASWEQGRCTPSPEDLYKLAKLYNVKMDYFLTLEDGSQTILEVNQTHDEQFPIDMKLTRGEYKLILELRERSEIDLETLEKMFNTILEYKQQNGDFKITAGKNMKFNITVKEFLNGEQ